jgi:hypothetical protein
MLRDLINKVKNLKAMVNSVKTAAATGVTIDLQGYNSVEFVANVGESGDTLSGSLYGQLVLQGAPDDGTGSPGTFVAITDAKDVLGASIAAGGVWATIDAAAEDDAVFSIGYIGASGEYRFLRCNWAITGTHTNGTPVSIVAILGAKDQPATNT